MQAYGHEAYSDAGIGVFKPYGSRHMYIIYHVFIW